MDARIQSKSTHAKQSFQINLVDREEHIFEYLKNIWTL